MQKSFRGGRLNAFLAIGLMMVQEFIDKTANNY